jgi:hypothetical protein
MPFPLFAGWALSLRATISILCMYNESNPPVITRLQKVLSAVDDSDIVLTALSLGRPPAAYVRVIGEALRSKSVFLECPKLLVWEDENTLGSMPKLLGPIVDWLHYKGATKTEKMTAATGNNNSRLLLMILDNNGLRISDVINALYDVIFNF